MAIPTVGAIADVVGNQDDALAEWANAIGASSVGRVVHRFASAAEADAAMPNPPRGAVRVTTDTDTMWQAVGTPPSWEQVGFTSGTIAAPFRGQSGGVFNPGASPGGAALVWSRIANRVFLDFAIQIGSGHNLAGLPQGDGVEIALPYPVATSLYPSTPAIVPRAGGVQMHLAAGVNDIWGLVDFGTPPYFGGVWARFLGATFGGNIFVVAVTHLNAVGSVMVGSVSYLTDTAP
jgi:hypothetical protein